MRPLSNDNPFGLTPDEQRELDFAYFGFHQVTGARTNASSAQRARGVVLAACLSAEIDALPVLLGALNDRQPLFRSLARNLCDSMPGSGAGAVSYLAEGGEPGLHAFYTTIDLASVEFRAVTEAVRADDKRAMRSHLLQFARAVGAAVDWLHADARREFSAAGTPTLEAQVGGRYFPGNLAPSVKIETDSLLVHSASGSLGLQHLQIGGTQSVLLDERLNPRAASLGELLVGVRAAEAVHDADFWMFDIGSANCAALFMTPAGEPVVGEKADEFAASIADTFAAQRLAPPALVSTPPCGMSFAVNNSTLITCSFSGWRGRRPPASLIVVLARNPEGDYVQRGIRWGELRQLAEQIGRYEPFELTCHDLAIKSHGR